MQKSFDSLNDHMRDCALTFRRLLRDNPSFRELCEDYEAAATALDFWQTSPRRSQGRANEYRDRVIELEAEIEAVLRKENLGQIKLCDRLG